MSHLYDSVSDRNFDLNRPPSSQQSTSQPFRSKSSSSNRKQDHQIPSKQPTKKATKYSSMSRIKPHQAEVGVSSQTHTVSSVSNIATACQNLNINSENDEIVQGDIPKTKNAKKKERLRKLKMPSQANLIHVPVSPQIQIGYDFARIQGREECTSLHDFFERRVSPMYTNANSRYLENLSHHPQFQLSHNIQRDLLSSQLPISVPSSPNYHHMLQPEYVSPKCIQNVMQHPLLSQTYNANMQMNCNQMLSSLIPGQTNNTPDSNAGSKNKKNKKKSKQTVAAKFDPYLSLEEVEAGLKDNTFIEGVIRINPKQFQHSYVASNDRSEQDILIDGIKNRNRALEGDIVVVQLIENDSDESTEENKQKKEITEENKQKNGTTDENKQKMGGTDENKQKNGSTDENKQNNGSTEENKQKKGKVVFIKEKVHKRTCIGNLRPMPDNSRQRALFVPRDHRIPRLNIPFTSWPDNFYEDYKKYESTLFLAKLTEWVDTRFSMGIIVCNIGVSGDMVTETKAIIAQTDLDIKPFGPEVRHLYPRLDYKIPEEEFKIREDCRKLCLFSIDPSNCRDIDDAVSCRELENGNYEIGVHIADVSHFLTEDTILDEKVAEKATTIYLVEKAYHMLPDDLCMLCSLFPGVDKLAFSVFWEITEKAEVLSHRFAKTVINSCAQLSYDHAQAVLDNADDAESKFPEIYNNFVYQDIYKVIKVLGKISATFRKKRFDEGALRIDQPKVSFRLNPNNGLPDSFCIYDSKESHQLIEEFMLLANMTVANRIREDHPKLAFLRCHPQPSGFMLKQLAKSLAPMGIELDISSAGDLHRSLLPHVGPNCMDKGKVMVLNMLCAKPMTRAKYFCADGCEDDDFHHYALNVPLYTHFTSPIRRYADIMVHRLLAASLKYREVPKWEIDHVRMVAAQCNKQKYNSKKASELSTELFTLKYIEMNSPVQTEAAVVEVREKYIDVIIIAMGLNRRIFFNNDFPGTYEWIKHEGGTKLAKMELNWNAVNGSQEVVQVIEVFSILQVELFKDEDMGKIDIKLIKPSA